MVEGLNNSVEDLNELFELSEDESEANQLKEELLNVEEKIADLEFRRMFSGKMDQANTYLDIQSGSGGTEAQDWAEMLLRMYLRWGENKGFKTELIEVSPGEVAGIKSATIKFEGEFAYGWLRTESGVHRLVRKSPFDSGNRRHTSFASIFVSPEVDDDIQIDLNPADIRIDTYRASGAGGQHVNKTDSAVRITHLPTGTVAECQDGRSQHKNKAQAMEMLYSKLLMEKQERQKQETANERKNLIGSGDRSERIRTYNFPQGRLTDHRINLTLYKLDTIMDGNIEHVVDELRKFNDQSDE